MASTRPTPQNGRPRAPGFKEALPGLDSTLPWTNKSYVVSDPKSRVTLHPTVPVSVAPPAGNFFTPLAPKPNAPLQHLSPAEANPQIRIAQTDVQPKRKAIPTPASAATQAPPQVASAKGIDIPNKVSGTITVKTHTRKAPVRKTTQPAADPTMPATVNPDYSGISSASELAGLVTKMIQAAQLPSQQALNNESKQSADQALAQAETTKGYYKALAGILGDIAPDVQRGYNVASGNDSAFAKGFSDGLAHVQGQLGGEANDVLGVSGGQVQAPQVAGQIGGTNATDALYNLGGYMPATTLSAQGAAARAAAAQLPATAAGQGAQAIQGINAQQVVDQKAISKKLEDLKAQVPGLNATYSHQLATEQLSKKNAADLQAARTNATNISRWTAEMGQKDKEKALAIQSIIATGIDPSTGKLTPSAQAKLDATLQGNERLNQSASRNAANWTRTNHYLSNPDGSPVLTSNGYPIPQVGYKLNVHGEIVKAPTVKKPTAMTSTQWSTAYGKMSNVADGLYHGIEEITNANGEVTTNGANSVPYPEAFQRLKDQFPKMPDRTIAAVLNTYWSPGEGGRPLHDVNPRTNPAASGPAAPRY